MSQEAATVTALPVPTTRPVAELDRRFYAFAVDRLIVWGSAAAAAVAAWFLLIEPGQALAGVLLVLAVVLVSGVPSRCCWACAAPRPATPWSASGWSTEGSGTPIGVGPAFVRQLILAIAGLPTFGLGLATLAWTAVADPTGRRRGWHDHVAHSVVLDVRPAPAEELVEEAGPQHIVNLTAMRLVPAPQQPPGGRAGPLAAAPQQSAAPPRRRQPRPRSAASAPPQPPRPAAARRRHPRPPGTAGTAQARGVAASAARLPARA